MRLKTHKMIRSLKINGVIIVKGNSMKISTKKGITKKIGESKKISRF
ncbi:MAG: hypothetical protein PHE67_05730 [Campylobacterales bacterium]|nr:hypothetical protein [Campylobacterales bacterium]